MGQNYPYLPKGQPGSMPQQNLLAQLGAAGQMAPQQPPQNAQGIPGVDPAMMAAAQQSVSNPNAGDLLDILPGPQDMAIGAAAGAVTGMGLKYLESKNFTPSAAAWVDKGLRPVSGWMEDRLATSSNNGWLSKSPALKEIVITPTLKVKPNDGPEAVKAAVDEAMRQMEQRQTGLVTEEVLSRFNEKERTAYQELMKQHKTLQPLHQEKLLERYGQISELPDHRHSLDDAKKLILEQHPGIKAPELEQKSRELLRKQGREFLETRHASVEKFLKDTTLVNFAEKEAAWFKNPSQANLNNLIANADTKIAYLESLGDKATKEQRNLLKYFNGLRERASGIQKYYNPIYQGQAEVSAMLKSKGVGPIGRMIGSSMNYLKRIFNGETFQPGHQLEKGGLFSGLGGTVFAGMFIFGQAVKKARDAKEGEKTKTFFHDFLGAGLFNFIGWEIGRKVLNGSGIFHQVPKMLPFLKSSKRPFNNRVIRYLPIIGEGFGKGVRKLIGENKWGIRLGNFSGKWLGGGLARLTLGGLATELIAMFVIGGLFQKVGEKLSHMIFGKPSEESLEGKSKKQQNGQQPQNAAMAPNGPQNPALNGAFNPMAQQGMPAVQPGGYFPATAMSQPIQRTGYANFPSQAGRPAYGQPQPTGQPTPFQAPLQAPKPVSSISPDDIRRSPAAAAALNYQQQIQNNRWQ